MQIPQYRQLYESLRHQIISGIYQQDDLLPSENQLADLHQITRMTVRQALNELVKDGYIRKQKGKGSFVNLRRKTVGLLAFRDPKQLNTNEEVPLESKIIGRPSIQAWDPAFFFPISEAERQAGCIVAMNLHHSQATPVMFEYYYLPNINLPGFIMTPFVNDSIMESLRVNYHVEASGVEQEVSCVLAKAQEAQFLKVSVGSPLVYVWRRYTTNRMGYYFYSVSFCNTQQYSLSSLIV